MYQRVIINGVEVDPSTLDDDFHNGFGFGGGFVFGNANMNIMSFDVEVHQERRVEKGKMQGPLMAVINDINILASQLYRTNIPCKIKVSQSKTVRTDECHRCGYRLTDAEQSGEPRERQIENSFEYRNLMWTDDWERGVRV
jgi:hypothetical protein